MIFTYQIFIYNYYLWNMLQVGPSVIVYACVGFVSVPAFVLIIYRNIPLFFHLKQIYSCTVFTYILYSSCFISIHVIHSIFLFIYQQVSLTYFSPWHLLFLKPPAQIAWLWVYSFMLKRYEQMGIKYSTDI